ncbi:MAG: tetratricopeptide repeat protein [Chrysiogenales bacterium]
MKKKLLAAFIVAFIFSYCAPNRVSVSTAKSGSSESYLRCIARGTYLLEQKKYDEAIGELKQASALKPDSDKANNFLGIAYFMKKSFTEASEYFQKALTINPAYAAAIGNLGNVQYEAGEVDAAVETLSKGIATFADNVELHFSLGNILLQKGELDQGFVHLKKVMELDPKYLERKKSFSLEASAGVLPRPEIFFRYARLYAATGNLEKTLEYLDKAKKTGFVDWERARHDAAFASLRDDPQVKKYLD